MKLEYLAQRYYTHRIVEKWSCHIEIDDYQLVVRWIQARGKRPYSCIIKA